jgi:DNA-directed RNA polymerase subunit H (RpoH/RPB5)
MEDVHAYVAYENIHAMLSYRGLKVVSPKLSKKDFSMVPGSVYEIKTETLTVRLIVDKKSPLYVKKTFTELIDGDRLVIVNMDKNKVAKYGPNVQHISDFYYNVPQQILSPPVRIASSEEVRELLGCLRIEDSRLAKISLRDPQIVWLGAKVGDIVVEESFSESATIVNEVYKLVIP